MYHYGPVPLLWLYKMENAKWLQLFTLFPAVEYLYLSEGIAAHVTRALREVDGEGVPTNVFPALQKLS